MCRCGTGREVWRVTYSLAREPEGRLSFLVRLRVLALVFSNSGGCPLSPFPASILGVISFFFLTGAQLALGIGEIGREKGERFVIMITVALAIWNVSIAFVMGVIANWMDKRVSCAYEVMYLPHALMWKGRSGLRTRLGRWPNQ